MSELVFGSKTAEEKAKVHPADRERPVYNLPGGGTRIRFTATGREVTIAGESLRWRLRSRRIKKPLIPGDVIMNGAEIVVDGCDAGIFQGWLRRGATDLGPEVVVVGAEPIPKHLGKSVPEQREEARIQENNQREADRTGPHTTAYVGR